MSVILDLLLAEHRDTLIDAHVATNDDVAVEMDKVSDLGAGFDRGVAGGGEVLADLDAVLDLDRGAKKAEHADPYTVADDGVVDVRMGDQVGTFADARTLDI